MLENATHITETIDTGGDFSWFPNRIRQFAEEAVRENVGETVHPMANLYTYRMVSATEFIETRYPDIWDSSNSSEMLDELADLAAEPDFWGYACVTVIDAQKVGHHCPIVGMFTGEAQGFQKCTGNINTADGRITWDEGPVITDIATLMLEKPTMPTAIILSKPGSFKELVDTNFGAEGIFDLVTASRIITLPVSPETTMEEVEQAVKDTITAPINELGACSVPLSCVLVQDPAGNRVLEINHVEWFADEDMRLAYLAMLGVSAKNGLLRGYWFVSGAHNEQTGEHGVVMHCSTADGFRAQAAVIDPATNELGDWTEIMPLTTDEAILKGYQDFLIAHYIHSYAIANG